MTHILCVTDRSEFVSQSGMHPVDYSTVAGYSFNQADRRKLGIAGNNVTTPIRTYSSIVIQKHNQLYTVLLGNQYRHTGPSSNAYFSYGSVMAKFVSIARVSMTCRNVIDQDQSDRNRIGSVRLGIFLGSKLDRSDVIQIRVEFITLSWRANQKSHPTYGSPM